MKITVGDLNADAVINISVEGSIDTLTAQDFENGVTSHLEDAKKLILDFAKVEYVSSAGLRALLGLNSQMEDKDGMVIINVGESVRDVFEMTGFDELLTIE